MNAKRELYVVLTDTGTWFTRLIKQFTGVPLNHASLSFDAHLEEVYSFGRKNVSNPFVGGFVREDMQSPFFLHADCAVYRCMLDEFEYRHIANRIEEMKRSPERYKYHLLGLFGVLLNTRVEADDAYFCSQFVASVFEQGGHPLVDKPACLVTPGDLAQSPRLQLLYSGKLGHYQRSNSISFGFA